MTIKHKILMAICVSMSQVAFSGGMGEACDKLDATVPCATKAWDVGIKALYLKPSGNDTGTSYPISTTDTNNDITFRDAEAEWGWGFQLEGSYHFSTGNDLTVEWYHFDDKKKRRNIPDANLLAGDILTGGAFDENTYTNDPSWDAVNLQFGRVSHFGPLEKIRFHGGVQFARIKSLNFLSGNDTTVDPGEVVPDTINYRKEAKFNGFGPRVGIDLNYNAGNGLSAYINGAGGLLVGTSKLDGSLNLNNPTMGFNFNASRTAIVPELDVKLGGSYTHRFATGLATLDIGWMVINYFNALTSPALDDTDFGVQGPYVGLKWVGSVA